MKITNTNEETMGEYGSWSCFSRKNEVLKEGRLAELVNEPCVLNLEVLVVRETKEGWRT